MDETPEELEQIRREAEAIDVHQYRKRFRALAAIALGALMAGLVWLVLYMIDSKRNPCERVRDHYCKQDPASLACKSYTGILDESLHDEGAEMRANIKAQCLTKIERLKEDDNITVK
jgi:SHS2 domain-containing protein